jgi:hypothetical protein
VQQVEIDRVDSESLAARACCCGQVARAAIGNPRTARAHQAALGDDDRPLHDAGERRRDQSLVVPDIDVVVAVRIGGIDQLDAVRDRRSEYRGAASVVAIGLGRQPHAAESDGHVESVAARAAGSAGVRCEFRRMARLCERK